MEGKLHTYYPRRNLNLFEYTLPSKQAGQPASKTSPNILLFIGGLYDNFGIPGYVSDLASLFPRHEHQQWSVMHAQLSSAMKAWGISDLNRDIDEIARCVTYIKKTIRAGQKEPTNIVLMGHSTGCQDLVHYLYSTNPTTSQQHPRPQVQGAILQAPVSDREAVLDAISDNPSLKKLYEKCIDLASQTPESEHAATILPTKWTYPIFHPAPLSVSRFLSLVSPRSPSSPSLDDLFSSDLSDETLSRTFGNIGPNGLICSPSDPSKTTMLILISGADDAVPDHVDKDLLIRRWGSALGSSSSSSNKEVVVNLDPNSQTVPNAVHDISGDDPASFKARMCDMREAVLSYINTVVVGSVDDVARGVVEEAKEEYRRRIDGGGSRDETKIVDSAAGLKL